MSLGYDIAQALPGMRAEAESRMTETVTVGEYTMTTSPTGAPVRTLVRSVYAGKGRVRWPSRGVVNANAPAMPVAVQEPYLSIPVRSAALEVGLEVTIESSTVDPAVVGRVLRVAGAAISGQVTANRYPLEEGS